MLSTKSNPIFCVAELGILSWSRHGKPTGLAGVEPDKPGLGLRNCGAKVAVLPADNIGLHRIGVYLRLVDKAGSSARTRNVLK